MLETNCCEVLTILVDCRLLVVLHVKPEDRQLTQFWMRGLGHQYRTQLLTYGSPVVHSSAEEPVSESQSDKPVPSSSLV